jgi:hypothetical protein
MAFLLIGPKTQSPDLRDAGGDVFVFSQNFSAPSGRYFLFKD